MMRTVGVVAFLTVLLLAVAAGAVAQVEKPHEPKEEIGTAVIGDGISVAGSGHLDFAR